MGRWWVALATGGGAVRRIALLDRPPEDGSPAGLRPGASGAAVRAFRWLTAWLDDPATPWPSDMPLTPAATPFQHRVRAALQAVPCGRTVTYGDLAARLGTAPRAVGGACRANPVPLAVPCHRVVAAAGLGGFTGESTGPWPAFKAWLLAREGVRLEAPLEAPSLKPRRAIPIGGVDHQT